MLNASAVGIVPSMQTYGSVVERCVRVLNYTDRSSIPGGSTLLFIMRLLQSVCELDSAWARDLMLILSQQ